MAAVATVAGDVVVDVCHSSRACAIGLAPSASHELRLLRVATAGVMLVVDFAHCNGRFGSREDGGRKDERYARGDDAAS